MSKSSAAFNIIFGANTSELDRALKSTEKQLNQTSRKLNSIGKGLTRAVTLPLIGIGAAAVKSAVDMEALQTSFISLTGGARQAAEMVKQLQDFSASTPFQIEGIAKAARQLIATGTELPDINETLGFLGDVAASTGNEIEDIAAIFAKVKAKGKVELESLNQLMERGIPIAEALRAANSSLGSELGAGAVSVEEFEAALRSMAGEGGKAHNAMLNLSETAGGKLSTALDVLQNAGAEIGKELLPVIKELLDEVIKLAKAFTSLDSSTQKNIIKFAALAGAIGPITRASGFLVGNVSKLVPLMKTLGGLTSVAFGSKTLIGVGSYTKGLRTIVGLKNTLNSLAAKTPVLLAASFAVAGISSFIGKVTKAKALIKEFNDIAFNAKKLYKSRKEFFEAEDKRLGFQAKALRTSNATAADYTRTLESLTEENVRFALSVREGTVPLSQTTGFINVSADALKILKDKMQDVEAFGGDKLPAALSILRDRLKTLAAEAADRESVTGIKEEEIIQISDLEKLLLKVAEQKARINAVNLFTPDEIEKQRALASALHDAAVSAQLLGAEDLARQYEAEADAADDLVTSLEKANAERLKQIDLVNQYGSSVNGLLSALGSYGVVIEENKQKETEATNSSEAFATGLVNAAQTIGGVIGSVNANLREQQQEIKEQYEQGTITQEEFVKRQKELQQQAQEDRHREIGQFILQLIAKVTAQAIANAYQTAAASGPAAAFTGPALAAAAVAGVTALMPKFRRGGMVTGETLAVVGDNQSGKEAIIPFERMGEFLGKFGGGGAQHIVVSGKLSGSDILLSAERSKRSVQRTTGVTF